MQAVLVMFRSDGERRSFSVTRDVTVIGRRDDCDLRIPLGDISRKHARIIKDGDVLRLEDLGSSNGTHLNGQRIERDAELQAGDSIQVGPIVFVLQMDGYPSDDELHPITAATAASAAMFAPGTDVSGEGFADNAELPPGYEDAGELEPLGEYGEGAEAPLEELEPLGEGELEPLGEGELEPLGEEGLEPLGEGELEPLGEGELEPIGDGELEPLDLEDELASPAPAAPPVPVSNNPIPLEFDEPAEELQPLGEQPIALEGEEGSLDDGLIPLGEEEPLEGEGEPLELADDEAFHIGGEHAGEPLSEDDVLIDLEEDPKAPK